MPPMQNRVRSHHHQLCLAILSCAIMANCTMTLPSANLATVFSEDSAPSSTRSTSETAIIRVERQDYRRKMEGFWLGQSIGNWTGLITEMDKIGGEGSPGKFYTRDDWRGPDQPAIWDDNSSDTAARIDFVLVYGNDIWGADDDTDLEYMYQHALHTYETSLLSPEQIRSAWLTHIYDEKQATPFGPDSDGFQNYLWVSNQQAHTLMLAGMLPPDTSAPAHNPHWDMIDAQLTTEIFGLYAPGRPDIALKMAALPIRTTARGDAALAAEFYIILHALAAGATTQRPIKTQLDTMIAEARRHLPSGSYTAAMFDFVKANYDQGVPWETTRDRLYQRYQIEQADGYDISGRDLYCNGCFASGINFGASLISLFYGEGDIRNTIKIATLCGWDSDNPAATWGGLLGFMLGRDGVEQAFGGNLSTRFNIHRTRKGFANNGLDDFREMAKIGTLVTDRAVQDLMGGSIQSDTWIIPVTELDRPK